MEENIHVENEKVESNGCMNQVSPLDIKETMRSLRVELQFFISDNERLIRAQEEQTN